MRARLVAILVGEGPWRMGLARGGHRELREVNAPSSSPADEATPTLWAQAVKAAAWEAKAGTAGAGGVVVAVPGAWCMAASLPPASLPRRGRHEALLYQLEEWLPLDAEAVAADFLEISGGGFLGVCVPHDRVRPLVDALEEAGVAVGTLIPAPLLVAGGLLREARLPEAGLLVALDPAGEGLDVFGVQRGGLRSWTRCDTARCRLEDHLRREATRARGEGGEGEEEGDAVEPLPVVAVGLDAAIVDRLRAMDTLRLVENGSDPDVLLLSEAARVASGGAPLLDLRRGPLAPADPLAKVRTPLIAAGMAALLLLASLTGTALWRAAAWDTVAQEHRREQAAAFLLAFPGRDVPAAPLARLRSEAARSRGVTAQPAQAARPSALLVLRNVLTHLPAPDERRFRVLELRIEPQRPQPTPRGATPGEGAEAVARLYLEGQARTHGDAEAVAAALRRSPGWRVDPPRTQGLPGGGVAFTLGGVLTAAQPTPDVALLPRVEESP